jgi:hypothetical protein
VARIDNKVSVSPLGHIIIDTLAEAKRPLRKEDLNNTLELEPTLETLKKYSYSLAYLRRRGLVKVKGNEGYVLSPSVDPRLVETKDNTLSTTIEQITEANRLSDRNLIYTFMDTLNSIAAREKIAISDREKRSLRAAELIEYRKKGRRWHLTKKCLALLGRQT